MKPILNMAATGVAILAVGLTSTVQAGDPYRGYDHRMPGPGAPACGGPAPRVMEYGWRGPDWGRPVVWERPACRPTPPLAFVRGCVTALALCPPTVAPCEPRVVVVPPVVRYVDPQTVVVQPVPVSETVWITNSNGSRTPVELRRADGGMYIGPKGEYYMGLPTNEQLRQLYGL